MTHARHMITTEMLDKLQPSVGDCVVIYDRHRKKALFFRKKENGYHLTLTRDRHGHPVRVRKDDILASMDYDGTIIPGDAYNAFELPQ